MNVKNFCTLSDSKYIDNVLVLNDSLSKFSKEYVLHYLCLDRYSYDFIRDRKPENIVPYSLDDIEQNDEELATIRNNNPSTEARNVGYRNRINPQYVQFVWCLSSYFSHHLLFGNDYDSITYLDSDIFFVRDWREIFHKIHEANADIAIIRNNAQDVNNGIYNVSFCYFNNTMNGNRCLFSWYNWVKDVNNPYYTTHGSCGDQKYLDLFPMMFEDVVVLDDLGVCQFAPWISESSISLEDVFYFHFSDFKIVNGGYLPASRHGIKRFVKKNVNDVYRRYYKLLLAAKKMRGGSK